MILAIVGIIIGWFVLGALINFIAYSGKPVHMQGTSQNAKGAHVILNILAVIALIATLFS